MSSTSPASGIRAAHCGRELNLRTCLPTTRNGAPRGPLLRSPPAGGGGRRRRQQAGRGGGAREAPRCSPAASPPAASVALGPGEERGGRWRSRRETKVTRVCEEKPGLCHWGKGFLLRLSSFGGSQERCPREIAPCRLGVPGVEVKVKGR